MFWVFSRLLYIRKEMKDVDLFIHQTVGSFKNIVTGIFYLTFKWAWASSGLWSAAIHCDFKSWGIVLNVSSTRLWIEVKKKSSLSQNPSAGVFIFHHLSVRVPSLLSLHFFCCFLSAAALFQTFLGGKSPSDILKETEGNAGRLKLNQFYADIDSLFLRL